MTRNSLLNLLYSLLMSTMGVVKNVTHILNNGDRSFVQWMGAQSIHRRMLRPPLVLKCGGGRRDVLQEIVRRRVSRKSPTSTSATHVVISVAEIPLQHTNLVGVERVELMGVASSGLDMNNNGECGNERLEEHCYSICMVRAGD